ncbi:MAG: VpsF family polysaccharide biosynthesis protein [Rubrivivax sp.]|nr:VpsF family polysaccharide biosynthesis protein [Rubrivivax sp.]
MLAVRYPGLDRLAWRLLLAGLWLHLLLSAHGLLTLGYPYEAPLLGPFPFKIHPGTYLVALALLTALAARGHPLRAAWVAARAEPLLAIHLGVMVGCLAWVIWRHGTSGAAFIVDTHWLPAMMALALWHMDDRRRAVLLRVLAVFIAANALIALGENALGQRLVPLYLQGQASGFAAEDHFRSSALMGHPLTSAKVTAMLLPLALLLPMRATWRWVHVALLLLSMLAFGGRAALGISVVVYGSWAVISMLARLVQGRYSYLQLTGGTVLLLLAVSLLAGVVIVTGLGERIFASLYLDNSASVRLRVWQAYDFVSAEQLWFGISAREIDGVALQLGLDPDYEAIENGWIYLSLQFGLVVFVFWLIGFGCLVFWLMRQAPGLVAAGVVVYLITASTSNSFASKTITQGLVVAYVVGAAAQRRQEGRARLLAAAQAQAWKGRRAGMPAAPAVPAWGRALTSSRAGVNGLGQGRTA